MHVTGVPRFRPHFAAESAMTLDGFTWSTAARLPGWWTAAAGLVIERSPLGAWLGRGAAGPEKERVGLLRIRSPTGLGSRQCEYSQLLDGVEFKPFVRKFPSPLIACVGEVDKYSSHVSIDLADSYFPACTFVLWASFVGPSVGGHQGGPSDGVG
jgi:hypothetical protein